MSSLILGGYTRNLRGQQWRHFAKLFLITISICALIFYYRTKNRVVIKHFKKTIRQEKGPKCEQEQINPFSEEVMRFDEVLPKIVCPGTDWVQCYLSECFVVPEILKTMENVVCYYRDIIYVNEQFYFLNEPVKVRRNQKYKLKKSDHVKVFCTGNKLNSLNKVSSRWHGVKTGFRPVWPIFIPKTNRPDYPYNIMIFAFDSTSHNGFIRKMPKSYKFLSDKAVILNSYNVVGDGTPGTALNALLTGKAKEELGGINRKKRLIKQDHVYANFIFYQLMESGYRTAFFEDMPWIGTFQPKYNSFGRQPANHYLRAFFQEESKFKRKYLKNSNDRYCVGAIPKYQLLLNLSLQFQDLDGKKFCFTLISDITRDNFNAISTADDDLVSRLQNLVARGALEDTLVIVMGDQGTRFNGIRNTYQGKLEASLPLMAIMLPEKLKRLRPDAVKSLEHNKDVLTTPFDVHATILDAIGLNYNVNKFYIFGADLPRSMSLLKTIPGSRTCSEAGVMPHYCSCVKWYNMSQSDSMFKQIALLLANKIDSIGREEPSKCAPRSLISIEWVLQQNLNLRFLKYWPMDEVESILAKVKLPGFVGINYYQAKIVMSPGRGVFEGTISHSVSTDIYKINPKEILRVNEYGNESSCVVAKYPHLSQYCYCKDKVPFYPTTKKGGL